MRHRQRFHRTEAESHAHALGQRSAAVGYFWRSFVKHRFAGLDDLPFCKRTSAVALLNSLLFVSLGLLQVADGFLTYIGLSLFDLSEVNPILNFCAAQVGLGCSITFIKFSILATLGLLFINRRRTRNCWGTLTLIAAVTFYTWVVNNNAVLVITS